jgi:hypothetical protein
MVNSRLLGPVVHPVEKNSIAIHTEPTPVAMAREVLSFFHPEPGRRPSGRVAEEVMTRALYGAILWAMGRRDRWNGPRLWPIGSNLSPTKQARFSQLLKLPTESG